MLWWCRSIGAKQMERDVEPADGGDTTRLVVVISDITTKLENSMLYRLCSQSKFSGLCESWGQFMLGECFVR
jgi:hypothetical protein